MLFANKKMIRKVFALLLLLALLHIFSISNHSATPIPQPKKHHINSNSLTDELPRCNPFSSNSKQYRVKFDSEWYPKIVPLEYNTSINFACLNQQPERPLILFWNSFFGDRFFRYENSRKFEELGCPVSNCETSADRSRYSEASLVVTHMRDKFELDTFPKYRPADLRTVFMLYESPMNSDDYSKFKDFYNLSATYRMDTDFPRTLNGMVWKENTDFDADYDFHGSKKGFAAALISNCGDSSGRLEYIEVFFYSTFILFLFVRFRTIVLVCP
jgi:hypothetical protein